MPQLKNLTFACIDCESTGLEPASDRIVEIACSTFTLDEIIDQFETIVDPERPIPAEVIAIHHITQEMCQGKPKIGQVLPQMFELISSHPIIGHGIGFDIALIEAAAKRSNLPCTIGQNLSFDTLRLARLYGESPSNSLEVLRRHFNIEEEGAHRAMNDVIVNIQVFKKLAASFETLEELKAALARPITMKAMPLGKHKGRLMKELPLDYLLWAARQNFDQDLLFSLRSEINRRKKGNSFFQSANPFSTL